MDATKLINSLSLNEKSELYNLLSSYFNNKIEFTIKHALNSDILSVRAKNIIKTYSDYYNAEYLSEIDRAMLLRLRNCGRNTYREICSFLDMNKITNNHLN